MFRTSDFVFYFLLLQSWSLVSHAQLCSSPNGLGKCSSNVFTCVFQNGYPQYFKRNDSMGDCSKDQFCCVNLPLPEDGSCAQRCGVSGAARQKLKNNGESNIKLDKNYNWDLMLQAQERSSRIVNGSMTDKYEFCWQGGIFIVDTEQLQNNSGSAVPIYVGGASLVAQDMALTAAHVLQPFITDVNFIIFVAFGFRNIEQITNIMNGSASWDELPVFRVPNEMAFHSGYNDRTYENNIAIIRFNPISCDNANVCPICLSPVPANPFQPWKGTCFASGWGATANSSVAPNLQKLEMVIPYPNDCLKSFMKLGLKNYELPSTMLCADSAPTQHGGTCDRDGGSPLVCQTKYGNWELTGIVGVGINRCKTIAAPTLFTNVGYYYDWINSYSRGTYKEETTPSTLFTESSISNTTTPSTTSLTTAVVLNESSASAARTSTPSSTPRTPSTYSSGRSTFRFQFNTPKVFLPKQAVVLDEHQKLVQAFFQERDDAAAATDNSSTTAVTTINVTTTDVTTTVVTPIDVTTTVVTTSVGSSTAKPSPEIFSLTLNNPGKSPTDMITDSSGGVRLFLKADNNLHRRKSVQPDFRGSLVTPLPILTSSASSPVTTLPSSATSTTATTTQSSNRKIATPNTDSTTVTSTETVTTKSTSSSVKPSSLPGITTTPAETLASKKSVTNSGYSFSKIVFHLRPDDNTSILNFLRRRYKDSKLYTESGTTAFSTTSATVTTSTAATTTTTQATETSKITHITFAPKISSDTTATRHPEIDQTRPTGPSVMMR